MDSDFEYSFSGMNMDFAIHLMRDGHLIPEGLFVDIVVEKCLLLQRYLRSAVECLTLVTNVHQGKATIQFIDWHLMKNPLLPFIITKEQDLEEQFYILWLRAHRVLKMHNAFDMAAELDFIYNFYHSEQYAEMLHA